MVTEYVYSILRLFRNQVIVKRLSGVTTFISGANNKTSGISVPVTFYGCCPNQL
jgi:hypothetical protein